MEHAAHVVVVGSGAAGSTTAAALRQGGRAAGLADADLRITVVGAEQRAPYNRTTVNKGLLAGAVDAHGIALPGMDELEIDWRRGAVAERLHVSTHTVDLRSGSRLHPDALVLATGADPRPLPAEIASDAREQVLTLRTATDTHRLRALLAAAVPPRRVVIAGAGLIGTETAAVLQQAGCAVTLVDPSPLPMATHVGSTVAAWVAAAHRGAGVDLRLGTRINGVRRDGAGGLLVTLEAGRDQVPPIRATAVLSCLGVEPTTGWLAGSGLPLLAEGPARGGLAVDDGQRVHGQPRLYAVGDLAAIPGPDWTPTRVEHWGAALEQGRIAAASVLSDLGITTPTDAGPPARDVPGYSTYVHATKLTIVGWPAAAVFERPVLGQVGDLRFAVALLDDAEHVVGAVGVGGARAVNALRPLITRRAPAQELGPAPTAAADSARWTRRSTP